MFLAAASTWLFARRAECWHRNRDSTDVEDVLSSANVPAHCNRNDACPIAFFCVSVTMTKVLAWPSTLVSVT